MGAMVGSPAHRCKRSGLVKELRRRDNRCPPRAAARLHRGPVGFRRGTGRGERLARRAQRGRLRAAVAAPAVLLQRCRCRQGWRRHRRRSTCSRRAARRRWPMATCPHASATRATRGSMGWSPTRTRRHAPSGCARPAAARGEHPRSRPDRRHDLGQVERARLLGDLRGVLALHLLGAAEHVGEGLLQLRGVDRAPAAVVALGHLPQRIRGGERERGAGADPRRARRAGRRRCCRAGRPTSLRPNCSRYCDVRPTPRVARRSLMWPAVELVAVRLADAVDHAHLQRDDRHRRERLRQELQRAVQDRVVQDHLVQVGVARRNRGDQRAVQRGARRRNARHARSPAARAAALRTPAVQVPRRRRGRNSRSASDAAPSALQTPTAMSYASCLSSGVVSAAATRREVRLVEDVGVDGRRRRRRRRATSAARVSACALAVVVVAVGCGGHEAQGEDGTLLRRGPWRQSDT